MKKTKSRQRRDAAFYKKFIATWNKLENAIATATELGMTPGSARTLASLLRAKGAKLKLLGGPGSSKAEAISKVIAEARARKRVKNA